jgi:hypothetical protein
MIITKDFYKTDVNRFDIEYTNDNLICLEISNVISWDIMKVTMTKEELQNLMVFFGKFISQDNNDFYT